MQTKKRPETRSSNKKIAVFLFAAALFPVTAQTTDEREKSNELHRTNRAWDKRYEAL